MSTRAHWRGAAKRPAQAHARRELTRRKALDWGDDGCLARQLHTPPHVVPHWPGTRARGSRPGDDDAVHATLAHVTAFRSANVDPAPRSAPGDSELGLFYSAPFAALACQRVFRGFPNRHYHPHSRTQAPLFSPKLSNKRGFRIPPPPLFPSIHPGGGTSAVSRPPPFFFPATKRLFPHGAEREPNGKAHSPDGRRLFRRCGCP